MGGGAKKNHESFTVMPSSAAWPPHQLGGAGGGGPAAMQVAASSSSTSSPAAALAELEPVATLAVLEEAPPPAASVAAASPVWGTAPEVTSVDDVDVLTPLPVAPPVGDPVGVPILLAGHDLEDSSASLVSYKGPKGAQEMLVANVISPDAEAKVMEALNISNKTVPVQVERQVLDVLPSDSHHAAIKGPAKVINTWLKHGTGDPAAAAAEMAAVQSTIAERLAAADVPDAERAMLLSYQQQMAAYEAAAAAGVQGQKLPKIDQHKGPVTKLVTENVPAPISGEGLPTVRRPVSRIAAKIAPDGTASWDGTARVATKSGTEYAVDLGDGYRAVYRPCAGNEGSDAQYSLRGALEVVAPPGAGHGQELVRRLEQLHLVAQPMTREEGEAAYLRANIRAQGLEKHPTVASALTPRRDLEDLAQSEVLGERAHEVIGLSPAAASALSRSIVLQSERRVAAYRLAELRAAVATATGHSSGQALAASSGYDPTPRKSGGWHSWSRFDTVARAPELRKAFGSRVLSHHLTTLSAVDLIRNGGVLASTERRALMGVRSGVGMSETADQRSGGARSVFLRAATRSKSGDYLEWDDPSTLLSRSDWYAYPTDHFGGVNPKDYHYSPTAMTRDPFTVATVHKSSSNEVMVRNGIDLLGSEAPSRIRCSSKARGEATLAALAARGVTHLGGKPVASVVVW